MGLIAERQGNGEDEVSSSGSSVLEDAIVLFQLCVRCRIVRHELSLGAGMKRNKLLFLSLFLSLFNSLVLSFIRARRVQAQWL